MSLTDKELEYLDGKYEGFISPMNVDVDQDNRYKSKMVSGLSRSKEHIQGFGDAKYFSKALNHFHAVINQNQIFDKGLTRKEQGYILKFTRFSDDDFYKKASIIQKNSYSLTNLKVLTQYLEKFENITQWLRVEIIAKTNSLYKLPLFLKYFNGEFKYFKSKAQSIHDKSDDD